jgi:type II secretory pathway component PulM
MEISSRDKRAIVFGAIGIAIIAVYLCAVEPALAAYDRICGEHCRLTDRVTKALRENDSTRLARGASALAEAEKRYGAISTPKGYSEQMTCVSDRITTAGQCGVQIKNTSWIAAKQWPDDAGLQMAQVQIDAEGDWDSLCRFLAALNHTEGVLSVEQIDIGAGSPGRLHSRLTLSVLVQADTQTKDRWTR